MLFAVAIVFAVYPTVTNSRTYYSIKYELKIIPNVGYYQDKTVYLATVENNNTFSILIYKQYTELNGKVTYSLLNILRDDGNFLPTFLDNLKPSATAYVNLEARDFNDTNFCLYGVK